MVKKSLISLYLILLISACSEHTNQTPFYRQPKTIFIEKNAAWADYITSDETPDKCKIFILTKHDVNEYFKEARIASEREYSHDLLMSRCYSSGKVLFKGELEGKWQIDRTRRGILVIPDGQSYFFYCEKCKSMSYTAACDIECINAN